MQVESAGISLAEAAALDILLTPHSSQRRAEQTLLNTQSRDTWRETRVKFRAGSPSLTGLAETRSTRSKGAFVIQSMTWGNQPSPREDVNSSTADDENMDVMICLTHQPWTICTDGVVSSLSGSRLISFMMFESLTGSSCLRNTKEVFSQALMEPERRQK